MTTFSLAAAPIGAVRTDRMADAPIGNAKPQTSAIWNGFMVVVNYLFEVVAKVAIPIIVGIAALFLFPPLAPACFVTAIAVASTRLVVKILDRYDIECLDNLKHTVSTFMERFYWLQLAAFVCALALSLLSPIVGCIVGGAVGIVAGFLIGVEKTKHDQQRSREAVKEVKVPTVQVGNV